MLRRMRKPWKVRGLGWRKTLKCDLSQGAASIQLERRAVRLMPPQRGGALIAASMARLPVARNDPVLESRKGACIHVTTSVASGQSTGTLQTLAEETSYCPVHPSTPHPPLG